MRIKAYIEIKRIMDGFICQPTEIINFLNENVSPMK